MDALGAPIKPPNLVAVLFGSKSRGSDDSESDIDLLVLTQRSLTRSERHALVDELFPICLAHEVSHKPVVRRDRGVGARAHFGSTHSRRDRRTGSGSLTEQSTLRVAMLS